MNKFLHGQRRKRWCRHLQRVCGTKQLWEVLAFSGFFDIDMLGQALSTELGADGPPARDEQAQRRRRELHHAKAEARARFMEGKRLPRHRDQQQARGASQPAARGQEEKTCTRREFQVLQDWDNGKLREDLNKAIVALGHGRLTTASGDYLDIGGSTGGGSRRIIDGWQPPDWREFLEDAQ